RLVQRGPDGTALQPDDRPRGASYADGVDADATGGGLVHDVERWGELIVLSVGKEDDRSGRVLPLQVRGQGRGRGPGRSVRRLLLQDRAREILLATHGFADRVQRAEDRATDGGRTSRPQA